MKKNETHPAIVSLPFDERQALRPALVTWEQELARLEKLRRQRASKARLSTASQNIPSGVNLLEKSVSDESWNDHVPLSLKLRN